MRISCRLRVIFAERNIRQKAFAEELGISQTTLSLLINNRSLPTLEIAYRIAEKLELPVESVWIKEKGAD